LENKQRFPFPGYSLSDILCVHYTGVSPPKRGRNRLFDPAVYKNRFFRSVLLPGLTSVARFERKDAYFMGSHYIAFATINLRHVIA
jgi:hypothetical protein